MRSWVPQEGGSLWGAGSCLLPVGSMFLCLVPTTLIFHSLQSAAVLSATSSPIVSVFDFFPECLFPRVIKRRQDQCGTLQQGVRSWGLGWEEASQLGHGEGCCFRFIRKQSKHAPHCGSCLPFYVPRGQRPFLITLSVKQGQA